MKSRRPVFDSHRRSLTRPVSEDHLKDLRAVSIRLENGEAVRLSIEHEVRIPSDPAALVKAARTGPARLAFWAYQSERALSAVRKAERECARVEGYAYQVYRKVYEEHENVDPTEPMLRAAVDQDPKVRKARIALSSRRREYGTLRALRDAMEHRAWTLRTLLQHRET